MTEDLDYRVAELERRMALLVSVGRVTEVDTAKARVRVAASGITTAFLPWLTRKAAGDREWWAPEIGEQVVLFCPNGEPTVGVVLPAIFQAKHPAPAADPDIHRVAYQDGAVTEYNRKTHELSATIPGDVVVDATGRIRTKAKNGIQHDGDASGALKGTVNGHCLCPFTGKPHVMVSASVTSSK